MTVSDRSPTRPATPSSRASWRALPIVFGALVGLIVGLAVLLAWTWSGRLQPTGTAVAPREASERADAAAPAGDRRNAIVRAVARIQHSVVTISAAGPRTVRTPVNDFLAFPFSLMRRRVVDVQWIGSGFLIDADGYVVTTEHVVRGATDLVVTLADGTSVPAHRVGTAARFDLALLRIQASTTLHPAPLGDSDHLYVGEWAIAIGSPFGTRLDDVQPSVSVGVISAIDRDIRPPSNLQGPWPYFGLLQTDAAINTGNSGGPLVNAAGEVIGVNMALIAPSSGQSNVGVNFSIPINTVKWVAEELRRYGEVRTPWVGWRLDEAVPPEVRRRIHLAEDQGLLIVGAVEPGSPADRAGVRVGDQLLEINGQDPYSRSRAERILFDTRVGGEPIQVTVLRPSDGQQHRLMVDVLENPEARRRRLQRQAATP